MILPLGERSANCPPHGLHRRLSRCLAQSMRQGSHGERDARRMVGPELARHPRTRSPRRLRRARRQGRAADRDEGRGGVTVRARGNCYEKLSRRIATTRAAEPDKSTSAPHPFEANSCEAE